MRRLDDYISIIVPTLNEEGNILELVERIAAIMHSANLYYEVIIIDDHSTDRTAAVVQELSHRYPIRFYTKQGARGKAYSLLEGVALSRAQLICLMDADLQYSPEAIVPMYEAMREKAADLVVTRRHAKGTHWFRGISTRIFHTIFCKWLFGLNYDTQSGLKLINKQAFRQLDLKPSPWSFDLELVVRAHEAGYSVTSYDIPFLPRRAEQPKSRVLGLAYELSKASLKLKLEIMRHRLAVRNTWRTDP